MIQLETDDFSINVPLKRKMHVDEFLDVADKLKRMTTHAPAVPQDHPAAFALGHAEEMHSINSQLQAQMEAVKKNEEHIAAILDYIEAVERRH
jgi:hypothetical protein